MPHSQIENTLSMQDKEKSPSRTQKHRRNREIAIALALVIVIFLASWGQTTYFGSDSWYFLVLLNLNGILMVLFFYLTVRNVARLISERRRKVFGSRLRSRLLIAFGALSLIPIILMYLAANRVIITSIDYWFTNTVSTTMDAALELGQNVYSTSTQRVSKRLSFMHEEIQSEIKRKNARTIEEKTKIIEKYFNEKEALLSDNLLIFLEEKDNALDFIYSVPQGQNFNPYLQNAFASIHWADIQDSTGYANLITIGTSDFALAILPLEEDGNSYIIVAELLGAVTQDTLLGISQGFDEYSYLKSLRRPLRLSFSLILGLLGLIMIFSAIFMAFRLSKELTAPIEALAQGTSKIAHGELDVLLEDKGEDELGQLVSSFNAMAAEVRTSNQSIQEANLNLESRNLFIENVLENINTGVCVFRLNGGFVSINKAACTMLNIKLEDWLYKNPLDGTLRVTEKQKTLFVEILDFLAKNPSKRWRKELEFRLENKNIKLFIYALILQDLSPFEAENEQKESILFLIEDITELSRVERLGAWREVAKRIAHEMKNPLTPIRLSAERLERKFSPHNTDPAFKECTHLILTESARMQEMIANFTNFAKMPEVQLQEARIVSLLQESLQIFKASYRNITWDLDIHEIEENTTALLHAESFKQAMMNIYLNASEAVENKEDARIITKISASEDEILLCIEDNGSTLSNEVLVNMFEPYYSNKKKGTGLGLAIVQSIFTDHKASVHASNNAMGGTSIVITFPKIV